MHSGLSLLRQDNTSKKLRIIVKRWSYLRAYATMAAGRRSAIQSITATIVGWSEWHCITTVDWFSVCLLLGSDGKHYSLWAWGPSWGGDDSAALAVWPVAVRCMAVQPVLRVATRSVGRPQGDSVSAVNGGISVNLESKNKSYVVLSRASFSIMIVRQRATKIAKPNCSVLLRFLIFISCSVVHFPN